MFNKLHIILIRQIDLLMPLFSQHVVVTNDLKTINEEDKNRLSRILDEIRNEQKKHFETEIEVNFDDEPSLAPIGEGEGKMDVKTGQKEEGGAIDVKKEGDGAGAQEQQHEEGGSESDTEQQFGITELQPRRKRFVFSTVLINILRTAGWMQL
jgi:hypothetical protein